MKNKKVLSTKAIILYVLAVLLIVIGVIFATPLTNDLFGINLDQVMIGVVLFLGGIYVLSPRIKKEKKYKWLIISELVVLILVSFLGFILPPFIKDLEQNLLSPNLFIGLILILHGIVRLFLERSNAEVLPWYLFLLNLCLIALGGFILDSSSINVAVLINVLVVLLFFISGIYVAFKAYKLPLIKKDVKVVEKENK